MKNLNKKGFTLVELVLVVAVICILSGVILVGTGAAINKYNAKVAGMINDNAYFESNAMLSMKSDFADRGLRPTPSPRPEAPYAPVTPMPTAAPVQNNAGGEPAAPTVAPTAVPTQPIATNTPRPTNTPAPTNTPRPTISSGSASAEAGNGNFWNGGGQLPINNIRAPQGTTRVEIVVEFNGTVTSAGGWTCDSYSISGNRVTAVINVTESNGWIINGGSVGIQASGSFTNATVISVTCS